MSYLHFNNDSANPALGQPGHDPLAKLRPIITALQVQLRKSNTTLKSLGLDETGCKFHGRCIFCYFNPSKPGKYHIKLLQLLSLTVVAHVALKCIQGMITSRKSGLIGMHLQTMGCILALFT